MTASDPFAAFGPLPGRVNVGRLLPRAAAEAPSAVAVRDFRGRGERTITFEGLEQRASRIAGGLAAAGVERGDRVCVFVRPSIELIAVVYALFRLGAVPVMADPGMGRRRLLECIERTAPRVLIGIPLAQAARRVFSASFQSIELAVTVGPRLPWGGPSLASLEKGRAPDHPVADTERDELAAILFTSGSTGPPKGVEYTHGTFDAQVRALRELYRFEPGEVDLCCFPLFALFDLAFGMTSVFPDLDVSRPATCDPRKVFEAAARSRATTGFASPAVWRKVVPWCVANGYKLEGMRRVLVAGAPVSHELIREFHACLPMAGDVHTPYGATEALPVTSVDGRDVVPGLVEAITAGEGTCVGKPAPGIDLRLIRITDEPIEEWSDDLVVEPGEHGEVVVRGPVVTRAYADEPEATRAAKIRHADGAWWHRMGDVGVLDEQGRLWFHGRKSHRIETRVGIRMPVPTENVFNTHPRVERSALVGIGPRGAELPVLVVEPARGEMPKTEVMNEGFVMQLETIGKKSPVACDIDTFLFHPEFPVDPRHNAKIHREELKAWAEERLR